MASLNVSIIQRFHCNYCDSCSMLSIIHNLMVLVHTLGLGGKLPDVFKTDARAAQ